MYPTRPRIAAPSLAGLRPNTRASPATGVSSPSRILINVDLPAPFAPTSPMTPGSTATLSESSAVIRGP